MNTLTLLGIALGLWAAFFQSLTYIATRHFVHGHGGSSRVLLVVGHVIMGIICAAALPLVWPHTAIPWGQVIWPLVGTAFFYLLGQIGLVIALRKSEPSQISPMLAFKLLVLALLTIFLRHEHILTLQWLAITCCLAGSIILNYSSDKLPLTTLAVVFFTCLFYALSDWNITILVSSFGPLPKWQAFGCSSLLCYALCGLVAVAFLPWYGSRNPRDWTAASPFSLTWLMGMFGLFACFGLVGVVYGNILQSTRAIMGVGLAALLTHLGHHHIENMRNRSVFYRRLTAAFFMAAAMGLWAYSKL